MVDDPDAKRGQRADGEPPTGDADGVPIATSHETSGSIPVVFSDPAIRLPGGMPEATGHERSGSINVVFSNPAIKPPPREPEGDDAAPAETRSERSGRVRAATEMVGERLGAGVGKVGGGVSSLGGGLARLGERVERLPAGRGLGAGVRDLGAGVSDLGASLTELPVIAKTTRGRVLVRGLVVGLTLVAIWVGVIVFFQLRSNDKPDLRPVAERVLVQVRDGEFEKLYDESSPRFRELMIEERFLDLMEDLSRTLGRFVEIAAINDTLVTNGPGGRIARIDMLLQFEKGKAKSTLSLQWSERQWKMLGISVDLPEELIAIETSQEARKARVSDPVEVAAINAAARAVVQHLHDDHPDVVWAEASKTFQATIGQADFARVEQERRAVVGPITRYLDTTFAQTNPSKSGATVVALVEYERAVATTRFGFERLAATDGWRLTSYKVILPMPLAVEPVALGSGSGSGAGSGSGSSTGSGAGSGSGSGSAAGSAAGSGSGSGSP